MNVSMVVIGDLSNPHDLKGGFSVHFAAEDFAANGSNVRASSRGFNLSVDAGSARHAAVHFLVVRLSDGLRIEGFVECIPGKRNFMALTGKFAAPERTESFGRFDSFLHWDGAQGVLSANFTAPRN
jgi:hypothetical protein